MRKYFFTLVLMFMASLSWAQEVEKKPELKGEASQGVNALKLATTPLSDLNIKERNDLDA